MDRAALLSGPLFWVGVVLAFVGAGTVLNAAIDLLAERYDLLMTDRLGLPLRLRRRWPLRGDRVMMAGGRRGKVLMVSRCGGAVDDIAAVRPLGENGKPDRQALVQWVRASRLTPVSEAKQSHELDHAERNGGR
jgi:hypothetical protein